jgi:hypothetical protein
VGQEVIQQRNQSQWKDEKVQGEKRLKECTGSKVAKAKIEGVEKALAPFSCKVLQGRLCHQDRDKKAEESRIPVSTHYSCNDG